ncbi:MAG TPA: hypothetical protein VNJ71_01575 [Gemmatimonadales bacterium]|jgi:predicted membrane-bound mannosyltransferase|nr:hypothetical protein [Gemmatimonadales bacterium]
MQLPRWFVWVWALGTLINIWGAYLAYGQHEMLHGHVHAALTLVFGYGWIRKANANAAPLTGGG